MRSTLVRKLSGVQETFMHPNDRYRISCIIEEVETLEEQKRKLVAVLEEIQELALRFDIKVRHRISEKAQQVLSEVK